MSPPYEKLAAWRLCHELAIAIRKLTATWHKEDRGLADQVRRASHSAASNIVEGCSKKGPREFRRFLDFSLGSLSEVEYDLGYARDAGIIDPATWEALNVLRRRAHGTARLLYNAISKRVDAL